MKEGIFNVNSIGVIKGKPDDVNLCELNIVNKIVCSGSKVALMHMVKRGGGPIVCITSTAGLYIDL